MEKLNYETIKTYLNLLLSFGEMDQSVRGFLYKFKSSLSDGTVKGLAFYFGKYSVEGCLGSFEKHERLPKGWLEQQKGLGYLCSENVKRGSSYLSKKSQLLE